MPTRDKVGFYQISDRLVFGVLMAERNFYVFSVITTVALSIYGVAQYLFGFNVGLSFAVCCSGVLIFLNLIAYRLHHQLSVASTVYILMTMSSLMISLTHGSIDGSAIYWISGVPAATFLFAGVRRGIIFNSIFFFYIISLAVLKHLGLFETFYTVGQYVQLLIAMYVFFLAGLFSQRNQESLRTEIAAQRQRLRIIMENMPAGVIVAEKPDGQIVAVNSSAEILLDQKASVLRHISDLVERGKLSQTDGQPFLADELPLKVALERGEVTLRNDIFLMRPDGTRSVLRMSGAPVLGPNGRITAAVAIIQDVTKEYEVDQMKSEFVALASHQLKTPLTSIKWAAESLSAESEKLDPTKTEYVDVILATVERLNRLVGDLLNVSHIETGRKFNLTLRPTDVVPVVLDAVREQQPFAAAHKVEIVTSALPASLVLHVDGDKTKEVLMNLVSNAIKYSKDGGKVEIGTASLPDDGEVIFVKDDGIGIPKAQQDKIFSRFFRADNVPEDSEGTGLGMYIAKAIVEKQGGHIWFVSEEGHGTIFYVQLPSVVGEVHDAGIRPTT